MTSNDTSSASGGGSSVWRRHFRPRTGTGSRSSSANFASQPTVAVAGETVGASSSGDDAAAAGAGARSGLNFPRSTSDNLAFPSSAAGGNNASGSDLPRRPGMSSRSPSSRDARPQTSGQSTAAPPMTRSTSSNNPFGRIARRLSLGTGRSEAANIAAATVAGSRSSALGTNSNDAGSGADISSSSASARGAGAGTPSAEAEQAHSATASLFPEGAGAGGAATATSPAPSRENTHRIRLVPHLEATRSLHFEPIERDVPEGSSNVVKVGRFSDKTPISPDTPGSSSAGGGGRLDSMRVAFKSKVVSRSHAEMWCEPNGHFFIRDTKSSSGTFLNHIRLSAPNTESKPFQIRDGDIIQLGVDYQNGIDHFYRCVKMHVELNRGWQRGGDQSFNTKAQTQLRALQGSGEGSKAAAADGPLTNRENMAVTDCCICLFSVTVCQSLFIAPCSHVFHYKCIRPMLVLHHPGFSCPLCRTFADLEADVEPDENWTDVVNKVTGTAEPAATASTPVTEIASPLAMATAVADATPHDSFVNTGSGSSPLARAVVTRRNGQPSEATIAAGSVMRGPASRGPGSRVDWGRPDTAVSGTPPAHAFSPLGDNGNARGFASNEHDEEEIMNDGVRPGAHHASSSDEANAESSEDDPDRTAAAAAQHESFEHLRRPSNPIPIAASAASRTSAGAEAHASPTGFDDARTPMNNTFLSTLAEAPALRPSASGARLPSLAASMAASAELRRASAASAYSSAAGDVYATPQESPVRGVLGAPARTQRDQFFDGFSMHGVEDDADGTGPSSVEGNSSHATHALRHSYERNGPAASLSGGSGTSGSSQASKGKAPAPASKHAAAREGRSSVSLDAARSASQHSGRGIGPTDVIMDDLTANGARTPKVERFVTPSSNAHVGN